MRLIGVTCAMSVGSVQEKASRPRRVRIVSMSDRSSVIWTKSDPISLDISPANGGMSGNQGGWDEGQPPKGKPGGGEPTPGATADDLPERWSVQRKMELVLRLLRGEALDAVSRESQVPAHELERWQRIFLEQGKRGLRTKAEPEERELILARAKIGELMMRLELAEDLIEKRGFTDEWKRRRG